jgi:mRNA interferase MazF
MNYKQGDIVLVNVIFSEGFGIKKRPALIISDKYYHNNRQEIIIAAITSNTERILPGDTKIKEWQQAGLKFPSIITGIIQTLKIDIIERKLGELTHTDLVCFQDNLKKVLGFSK